MMPSARTLNRGSTTTRCLLRRRSARMRICRVLVTGDDWLAQQLPVRDHADHYREGQTGNEADAGLALPSSN